MPYKAYWNATTAARLERKLDDAETLRDVAKAMPAGAARDRMIARALRIIDDVIERGVRMSINGARRVRTIKRTRERTH